MHVCDFARAGKEKLEKGFLSSSSFHVKVREQNLRPLGELWEMMTENGVMQHLRELSVSIGSRGPTSQNEKKASMYIEQTMKSIGMSVNSERFESTTSFFWIVATYVVLFVTAVVVFPLNALVAFLLDLVTVAIFLEEISPKHILSRLMPKGESRNIIGKIMPKNTPKKLVVLTGHYDSAKPLPFFHPAIVRYVDLLVVVAALSMTLTTAFYGLGALFQFFAPMKMFSVYFWYASFPFMGYLGLMGGGMAYGELFTKPTNGANDNASGISVILSVGEILSKEPLKHTEIWCVASGCEEAGTVGMMRFLDKHAATLKDSFVFSVDCVGIGNLRYVVKEGLLRTISVPEELVNLVSETACRNPELEASPIVLKYKASDSYPALSRGLKAICIISVDEKNLPPNWHWRTDVYQNIEENVLKKAQKFLLEILRTIDTPQHGC